MKKNVAKGPSNSEKKTHKEKNVAKRPPHIEKSSRKEINKLPQH